MTISYDRFARTFGKIVSGVDLTKASNDCFSRLKGDLIEHKVLVFSGQDLDQPENLMTVMRGFGEPMKSAFSNGIEGFPEIVEINRSPEQIRSLSTDWHSDSTYLESPPLFSAMYAVQVPEIGGNTLFCDSTQAFEDLSLALQGYLMGLNVVNISNLHSYNDRSQHVSNPTSEEGYRAVHPAVRIHEITGGRSIYANEEHTLKFDELTEEESRPTLEFLKAHLQKDKYVSSVNWQNGTFAIWDNRQVQHRAVDNFQGEARKMVRVILSR